MQEWLASKGFGGPIVIDGRIHRADRFRHRGKSAWYVAWTDPLEICVAGEWRTGEKWEYKVNREMTRKEAREVRAKIDAAIAEAERERVGLQRSAAARADIELRSGTIRPTHQYLARKKIAPHGAVALGEDLLVPMTDIDGTLWGLQRILADGAKFFLTGQKAAGCFHQIGAVGARLVICEGFATAASIHEATGLPVFCAFSASNLDRVAIAVKRKYPAAEIIIAGDNDAFTDGNPGKAAAEKVARALRLWLCLPSFWAVGRFTDFNDLACAEGLAEVARQINSAELVRAEMTEEWSRNYYQLMRG